jgi:hypothetical protein
MITKDEPTRPPGARPAEYRRPAWRQGRFAISPTACGVRRSRAVTACREPFRPASVCRGRPRPSSNPRRPYHPALRRSPHCGGRSTPSRDKPLTARLVARPAGERSGAPERVEIISSSIRTDHMPMCTNCGRRGADHDWSTPPCVREPRAHWHCHCVIEHPNHLRGRCLFPIRGITTYFPDTEIRKPVSSVIGRFLRSKRQ